MRNPNFGLSSIFLSLAVVGQIQALQSPLIGSKWRVSLDMGREDNTWMPENWAASGARLGLDTTVEFTDFDVETHEPLISKQGAAKALRVCSGPSSFTAENGTRKVIFKGGGYYLTRVHGMVPGAEAVLRFWLDCDTGAARRDVSVAKNTRIFFSTGLWDDMVGLEVLTARRDELVAEMDALLEAEKNMIAKERSPTVSVGAAIRAAMTIPAKVKRQEKYDALRVRLSTISKQLPSNIFVGNYDRAAKLSRLSGTIGGEISNEREVSDHYHSPTTGKAEARKKGALDVIVAPVGTLALKQEKLLRTEYHILGRFSMTKSKALQKAEEVY